MNVNEAPDTGPIARARPSGTRVGESIEADPLSPKVRAAVEYSMRMRDEEPAEVCEHGWDVRLACSACMGARALDAIAQRAPWHPDPPFGLRFTLPDDEPEQPSWHRRMDDLDEPKRARWEGVLLGIAIGIVLTMAAVAWRTFGTLLP